MSQKEDGSLDKSILEKPYTFFLFKALTNIYESWIAEEVEDALKKACRLVVFLPTDIKKVLWPMKQQIKKAINEAYGVRNVDWFTTQSSQNRNARRTAVYYLEPFLDKMVMLLDEKNWLERGALRPRYKSPRKLTA